MFQNFCCQTNKIATIQHKTDLRTLRARHVPQSQLLQFQVLTTLLSDLAGLYICKFYWAMGWHPGKNCVIKKVSGLLEELNIYKVAYFFTAFL